MDDKLKSAKLFSEFPPITTKQWEEKIMADLKGADYEKKLIWKTTEGINVKPYYRAEDLEQLEYLNVPPAEYPFVRCTKTNNNWEIRQDIEETNPERANKIAVNAIARGAEGIGFDAKEIYNAEDLKVLLQKIDLAAISIHFTSAVSFSLLCDLLIHEVEQQKIDASKIKGSFNFDPLTYLLMYGKFQESGENTFSEAADLIKKIQKKLPHFQTITINGQYFHNGGASIVQELAFGLASANEYLAQLTEKGISIDDVAPKIQFVFSIGSNYFMEIAKLRTVRLLWAKIVEQYKPASKDSMKCFIHAVTSEWNKSTYDLYVNMLRNTTEAMSAAIGGCDSMTVNTFDNTIKKSNEFSERNARNTQLVLKKESYLDNVVDPSAGSYYIENLTDSIAEATWKLFLEVEENGGFIKVAESGYVINKIEETCQKRDLDIAMRKQIILGTNQYPNLNENMLDKMTPHADISKLGGLKQYRGAGAFEALRLSTEAFEQDGHKRPAVFLFTFGNLAMRKARAGFTTNFFGCAGYKIIDNTGFKTVEDGVAAAIKSEADIIVFCSSDDEYAELVPKANKMLKESKPDVRLVVAGNPVQLIDILKQSGVDDFIHVRSNLLDTLGKYHVWMGII
jgi:methylmalonyl-CoA mutase